MTTIESRYAALANGITLHYAACGTGPPIVFVHGFPEFWYEWKDLLADFGRDHLAVAPDMRGYNLSSKPGEVEAYRAKHLVEDLRLLLDHLGAQRCAMVAHDWGGAVAWSFAALHPERLDRLVVINAPHPVIFARELRDNPAQQQASAYMNLFRSAKAERVLEADNYLRLRRSTLDAWAANGGTATEADRAAYLAAWSQPGALTGGLNYYRASPLHPPDSGAPADLAPDAFRVRVPTLVIWGERDHALLLGNLEGLERQVQDLRVIRIPEGSHWVVHEQPARIAGLIREFLGHRD
ncbi:MAG TPA: alpha/beta hydrolase [Burkholderiales bacterium]|jgi:pimeloyl-ACP methyl ester carboxylesterase